MNKIKTPIATQSKKSFVRTWHLTENSHKTKVLLWNLSRSVKSNDWFRYRICLMRVKSDCHLHFWFLIKPCHQPLSSPPRLFCVTISLSCAAAPSQSLSPLSLPALTIPPVLNDGTSIRLNTKGHGWQQQQQQQKQQTARSSRVEGFPVTLDPIRRTAFSSIISSCLPSSLSRGRCGWYFDSCCFYTSIKMSSIQPSSCSSVLIYTFTVDRHSFKKMG